MLPFLLDIWTTDHIKCKHRLMIFRGFLSQLLLLRSFDPAEEDGWKRYLGEEAVHVARLGASADTVSDVVSRAASNVAVQHQPLASSASSTCNDACREKMLMV